MPYDKLSFLSGVAVGRNMESWPAFDGSDALVFIVKIDSVLTSMRYRFLTHLESGVIDWGDGIVEQVQQQRWLYNTHVYSDPGVYVIQVTGTLLGVSWGQATTEKDPTCLVSVNTPIPDIPENRLPYVVDAIYSSSPLFQGCSNLAYIHPQLFKAYTREGVTFCTRSNMFGQCKNLKTVPAKLFHNVHFRGLTSGGTLIRPDLQAYFTGCTSLKSVPDGLFDNPWLEDCYNIQSLFAGCSALEDFPDDLFSGMLDVTNCVQAFENCKSITKRVPELWNSYPNANGTQCFRGCINAENYEDIPAEWK